MENISIADRKRMMQLLRVMKIVAMAVGPLHSWWDLIDDFDRVLSGGKFFPRRGSAQVMISEAEGYFVEAGLAVPVPDLSNAEMHESGITKEQEVKINDLVMIMGWLIESNHDFNAPVLLDLVYDLKVLLTVKGSVTPENADKMIDQVEDRLQQMGIVISFVDRGDDQLKTFEELNAAVINWGRDREIVQNGTVTSQLIKTMEELGELAGHVARGKCIKDDLGDVLVTLIMVAEMSGTSLVDGLAHAYGEIKDRKGRLNVDGVFIKEGDYWGVGV